jgi:hypothetical protein
MVQLQNVFGSANFCVLIFIAAALDVDPAAYLGEHMHTAGQMANHLLDIGTGLLN